MTIQYKIDKGDLNEYLMRFLKKSKSIRKILLVFNLLLVCAFLFIVAGIFTEFVWCFLIGVSLIGLNAYRPNLKKEVDKKVSELERENKLKNCFGLINLMVEKDGLIVRNGQEEEKIPVSSLTNMQLDDRYLTINVTHGLLFIPINTFVSKDEKLRFINAVEALGISRPA